MKVLISILCLAVSFAANADSSALKSWSKAGLGKEEAVSLKSNFRPSDIANKDSFDISAPPRGDRPRHGHVYCSYYSSSRVSGYSLYRTSDRADLANAVWTAENRSECEQAASLANQKRANIACARYYNSNAQTTAYSVYRISNNQDLGKATIGSFSLCQRAVQSARHGIFCSTYVHEGATWWSMYDIRTGQDLGTQVYATLERCEQEY